MGRTGPLVADLRVRFLKISTPVCSHKDKWTSTKSIRSWLNAWHERRLATTAEDRGRDPRNPSCQGPRSLEREQEVAIVVYRRGCATANEVQDRLSDPLSNGAVRSMLNRLVGKRILKRQRRGPHGAFVYLPALTDEVIEERALRQLANDFFDGSLFRTAAALDKLVARLSMRSNRWPAE